MEDADPVVAAYHENGRRAVGTLAEVPCAPAAADSLDLVELLQGHEGLMVVAPNQHAKANEATGHRERHQPPSLNLITVVTTRMRR